MDILFGASILAAFLAGMVALFAPCCITVLLPSYLAAAVRTKRGVLAMTFLFFLGIATVLVPIGLGAAFVAQFFRDFHQELYMVGGAFMVVLGVMAIAGKALALPFIKNVKARAGMHPGSVYVLGVLSGAATSCCAPVLAGAMALAIATASFWHALIVSFAYVFGMVIPLFVAAYFYDRFHIEESKLIKGKMLTFELGGKKRHVHSTNLLAGAMFILIGGVMAGLGLAGNAFFVTESQAHLGESLSQSTGQLFEQLAFIPEWAWAVVVLALSIFFVKQVFSMFHKNEEIKEARVAHGSCHSTQSSGEQGHGGHTGHSGHDSPMMSHGSAAGFLRRFWIVTILLVPLALTNEVLSGVMGIYTFALGAYVQFAIATIIFLFGLVFFQHAGHELRARKPGMMTLVSLAVGAGYLFSAAGTFFPAIEVEFYLEIATLIWVLLFGHYLEARSSGVAGDALAEVAKLLPKEAHKKGAQGEFVDVPVGELAEGDVVLVRPGEKVPADGEVLEGTALVNEAHLTGEALPVKRGVGDSVPAGGIVMESKLVLVVTRVGLYSTVGQIETLVKEAQKTKPRAQKIADVAASVLTAIALVVSISTLLVWTLAAGQTFVFAATLAITVLVIACPHALGLAIPTVSTIATTLASRHGLFIKNMGKIETIKGVDVVLFDKTGTLTTGIFGVRAIETREGVSEDEVLSLAASLEESSTHPVALSIREEAKKHNLPLVSLSNVEEVVGKGLRAMEVEEAVFVGREAWLREEGVDMGAPLDLQTGTRVYVARAGRLLGVIVLADEIKVEAKEAVRALASMGIEAVMITGDRKEGADSIGREIGILRVLAEVHPEDKYKEVEKLQKEGRVVLMVGDGINDAPALMRANVGVAIGAGTDLAVEAGDVVLTRSNPMDVVRLVRLSRAVYRKMIQNLWWALGYNIVAIPLAAGVLAPWGFTLRPEVGALVMSLSTVIVVLNALTLRRANI